MSRLFVRSSSELIYSSAVLTAVPFTFACWFNVNYTQNFLMTLAHYEGGSTGDFWVLSAESTPDIRASIYRSGVGSASAISTSGYSENVWHHACGVFAASNDRRVYVDGGSKGTNSTDRSPDSTVTATAIGGLRRSDNPVVYTDGSIAEAAIWNATLTDEEVAVLATGIRPIFVRPQSLVMYLPLIRDNDEDLIGGLSFNVVNTPTISAHAPIIYGGL